MLKKKGNRWALVSTKNPSKVLKWFGKTRPSKTSIGKEEARVDYFKHHKKEV